MPAFADVVQDDDLDGGMMPPSDGGFSFSASLADGTTVDEVVIPANDGVMPLAELGTVHLRPETSATFSMDAEDTNSGNYFEGSGSISPSDSWLISSTSPLDYAYLATMSVPTHTDLMLGYYSSVNSIVLFMSFDSLANQEVSSLSFSGSLNVRFTFSNVYYPSSVELVVKKPGASSRDVLHSFPLSGGLVHFNDSDVFTVGSSVSEIGFLITISGIYRQIYPVNYYDPASAGQISEIRAVLSWGPLVGEIPEPLPDTSDILDAISGLHGDLMEIFDKLADMFTRDGHIFNRLGSIWDDMKSGLSSIIQAIQNASAPWEAPPESSQAAEDFKQEMEDKLQEIDDATAAIESLAPRPSPIAPSISDYVDVSDPAVSALQDTMQDTLSSPLILQLFLVVVAMATVGYILYGRRNA